MAIMVGIAATALVGVAQVTGRSNERVHLELNKILLGGKDEEARGAFRARKRMSANPFFVEEIGRKGAEGSYAQGIFDTLHKIFSASRF